MSTIITVLKASLQLMTIAWDLLEDEGIERDLEQIEGDIQKLIQRIQAQIDAASKIDTGE